MKHVRRWVRNVVQWIPIIGETRVLPILRAWYERLPALDRRRKRYARGEARRLLKTLKSGSGRFTVVFDCEVTGLAYGDLLHVLGVARFLQRRGGVISVVFVETEGPHFLGGMNQVEIDQFIDDAMEIARVVLTLDRTSVERISPEELRPLLDGVDSAGVLFDEFTRNRRPYNRDAFNVFNQLMATIDAESRSAVLFGPGDFEAHLPEVFWTGGYITWHCRYSTRCDQSRLTNANEFATAYHALRKRFPGREIVVVSDAVGCQHYSAMAVELDLAGVSFSKDFSSDFLGDCALIMGSEYFFCYRGGGILEVPFTSSMPYEITAPVMNETMWDVNRLGAWQSTDQVWNAVPRCRPDGELDCLVARRVVLSVMDEVRT
jgi:hypothetical protein